MEKDIGTVTLQCLRNYVKRYEDFLQLAEDFKSEALTYVGGLDKPERIVASVLLYLDHHDSFGGDLDIEDLAVMCGMEVKAFQGYAEQWSKERDTWNKAERARLRSMPYSEYLATDHWKSLRRKRLRLSNSHCELCFKKDSLDVHHKTYERRGEEEMNDLIVLCRECHSTFHGKPAKKA